MTRERLSLHAVSAPTAGAAPSHGAVVCHLAMAGGAPDWVQLVPAPVNGVLETVDGRGPYRAGDLQAIVEASLQPGERLVIDENHAHDLAGPKGGPTPARGWIVELAARGPAGEGGVWGRVEWTEAGRRLVAEKEYRSISPALNIVGGAVRRVLRASLVNLPNLRGIAALNMEESDMDRKKLAAALGLGEDADDEAILAAVGKLKGGAGKDDKAETQAALQSALAPIAKALGLGEDADAAAVLAAAETKTAAAGDHADSEAVAALQAELTDVTTKLNAITESTAREKATLFVDNAIKAGRVGVKPMRERYIAMHAKNPQETEELINAMPVLHGQTLTTTPATEPVEEGDPVLMAQNATAYQQQLAKAGVTIDYAAAVAAVAAGKHKEART